MFAPAAVRLQPRGDGVVMVSGRSRLLLLRVRVGAWLCPRSARPASRASWAPGPSSTRGCYRGRTCRARPTRSRSGPHRRCRRWRRRRRGAARYYPGRQRSRELARAPAPRRARPRAALPQPVWKSTSELGYPPRHRADAVTATTPSSRRGHGDNVASMALGA